MPTSFGVLGSVLESLKFLLSSVLVATPLAAQTGLNDVHIMPRDIGGAVVSPSPSLQLVSGAYLHVVKRDVNLVLVPVRGRTEAEVATWCWCPSASPIPVSAWSPD